MDIIDIYESSLEKDGEGFLYVNIPTTIVYTGLSPAYVEPIDEKWFAVITVSIYQVK